MNPLLLKIGLGLISRKINSNSNEPQKSDFHKSELKKAVPIWATVIGVILTVLSAKGIIDPVIYQALTALVSNPEIVNAVGAAGGF